MQYRDSNNSDRREKSRGISVRKNNTRGFGILVVPCLIKYRHCACAAAAHMDAPIYRKVSQLDKVDQEFCGLSCLGCFMLQVVALRFF